MARDSGIKGVREKRERERIAVERKELGSRKGFRKKGNKGEESNRVAELQSGRAQRAERRIRSEELGI